MAAYFPLSRVDASDRMDRDAFCEIGSPSLAPPLRYASQGGRLSLARRRAPEVKNEARSLPFFRHEHIFPQTFQSHNGFAVPIASPKRMFRA